MNKYQKKVVKVAKYLNTLRPDLPYNEVIKDARSTVKGIIKHIELKGW